jgi:glycosyltransferase involved in cell wall biosynthesis
MKKYLVSVIVPFYNSERYLAEAVESVLNQTYRPIECLLVNDGSTDGSAALAAAMAEKHTELRLLCLPGNRGPAAARNTAIAKAGGDFVTFLDADDCMLPQRLAFQVGYLTEHPDVDLVFCAEERLVESGASPEFLSRYTVLNQPKGYYIMSMMVRPSIFDRVGPFNPTCRVAEDLDWLFRAAAAGVVIAKVNRVMTRHRMHESNLSYRVKEIQSTMIRSLHERITERRKR